MGKTELRVLEGKAGVKLVYDEMADCYDYSKYFYWTRRMEEGEEKAIEKWIRRPPGLLVDVGCGTGRYAVKKGIEGIKVVALDVSPRMLRKVIEKAKRRKCHQYICLVLADGEYMPFRDESFGCLICTLTFDHFQECESVAHEFSRVLRQYGICVVTTFNPYTINDLKRREKIPLDTVCFQTENTQPTVVYEGSHSAEDIKRLFRKRGFDAVDAKGCCYWHLLPSILTKHYKVKFDSFFNSFKPLLKFAELHAVCMEKRR